MSLVSLNDLLESFNRERSPDTALGKALQPGDILEADRQPAQGAKSAIAGLVCLGWEEVRAFIGAAEAAQTGVALMVGPAARADKPLPVWGKMITVAAGQSDIPFALHLDHGKSLDEVRRALDEGFTSVMYDGSHLPLRENVHNTRQMVEIARKYNASTEGEIGFVGYAEGAASRGTDAGEAHLFAKETGVDFMAVSVGNVHLQRDAQTQPDWHKLEELAEIGTPLVIHGGSGFDAATRRKMAQDFNVRKFNIGTELRQVFGNSLREFIISHPGVFDHLTLLRSVDEPLKKAAFQIITQLRG